MLALIENVEFWKALSAMLWPVVALIVFMSARNRIYAFLGRDNLSIKVAGMELSVADATKSIGSSVADLQKRLADLESKLGKQHAENAYEGDSAVSDLAAGEEFNVTREQAAAKPFSILWVDDYPSNNAFLVEQFESEGIQVKLALTTENGLKALENEEYQLIITDLGRKEGTIENPYAGLDLIKQVRALGLQIPILVYAGPRGIKNKTKLVSAGASMVTQSPIDVQSFVQEVRTSSR